MASGNHDDGATKHLDRRRLPAHQSVEILEFTYITATYAMHATMSRALRLEFDDVDDPVQERPDSRGNFSGLDVMAAADTENPA